jgi:hypothetical protein
VPDPIKAAVEKALADQFGMPGEDAVHRMAGAAEQSAINEKMVAHDGYLPHRSMTGKSSALWRSRQDSNL